MNTQQQIDELSRLAADVRSAFGELDAGQINWKPSPERWSVGQCFDHLTTANGEYLTIFEKVARGEKRTRFWERVPLLPSLFGKLILQGVAPETKRKFKAPAIFQPSSSALDAGVIERFLVQQEKIKTAMRGAAQLDAAQIIITSPISKLITLSLRDAYAVIIAHEKRHFLQAQRVQEEASFPRER
ncbi:MAG TPA: DinB family protein [Pyrinomonadaceae bacterium]|nr:DinB family protein [Pyrinomonadaceae bacterium]